MRNQPFLHPLNCFFLPLGSQHSAECPGKGGLVGTHGGGTSLGEKKVSLVV